ncbi:MAG: hypothetical protein AB7V40_04325 [Methyloceanibacter sp.]
MTEPAGTEPKQGFQGGLRHLGGAMKDTGSAALRETLLWSAYQWTVLALLVAIFLLVALSYGGIRAELAAMRENAGAGVQAPAGADLSKRMSELESSLGQALTEMKSGLAADLAAIGAKLDALSQKTKPAAAAPPPPAPKPQPKPKPQ